MKNITISLLALATLAGSSSSQTFSGDVTEIPYSIGGSQQLFVTAGSSFANELYFVAGTVSGTAPGFSLAGFHVPLNPDFYFNYTVANPNTPILSNSFGSLDGSGFAQATFSLGAMGFDPSLIGTTVSHSYLVLGSGFSVIGASPAVDCLLVSGPQPPSLVINEVDYDQPSTDTKEFIEILNVSSSPVDLTYKSVELLDGASSGTVYTSISLASAGILQPGQYLVIGSADVMPAAGALSILFASATENIQDGAADAIRIRDLLTGQTIDAVGYAGTLPGVTEGTSDLIFDIPDLTEASIARCPNGSDTEDNDADFFLFKVVTPGADNVCG